MTEPIFERAWDAFTRGAEHAGADIRQHLPHAHYHQPDVTATPATEATMSLATIVEAAKADIASIEDVVKHFTESHLPQLGEWAQALESSPLAKKVLPLIGTLDPAVEEVLVGVLDVFAAKAAVAPAAPAVPVAPEPVPAA